MVYDRNKDIHYCPETVDGRHGLADKHGKCPYCHKKYEPVHKNYIDSKLVAEDIRSYRYHYDPDFGSNSKDFY